MHDLPTSSASAATAAVDNVHRIGGAANGSIGETDNQYTCASPSESSSPNTPQSVSLNHAHAAEQFSHVPTTDDDDHAQAHRRQSLQPASTSAVQKFESPSHSQISDKQQSDIKIDPASASDDSLLGWSSAEMIDKLQSLDPINTRSPMLQPLHKTAPSTGNQNFVIPALKLSSSPASSPKRPHSASCSTSPKLAPLDGDAHNQTIARLKPSHATMNNLMLDKKPSKHSLMSLSTPGLSNSFSSYAGQAASDRSEQLSDRRRQILLSPGLQSLHSLHDGAGRSHRSSVNGSESESARFDAIAQQTLSLSSFHAANLSSAPALDRAVSEVRRDSKGNLLKALPHFARRYPEQLMIPPHTQSFQYQPSSPGFSASAASPSAPSSAFVETPSPYAFERRISMNGSSPSQLRAYDGNFNDGLSSPSVLQRSVSYHFHTPSTRKKSLIRDARARAAPNEGKRELQRTRSHIRAVLCPAVGVAPKVIVPGTKSRSGSVDNDKLVRVDASMLSATSSDAEHAAPVSPGSPTHDHVEAVDEVNEYHRFILEEATKRQHAQTLVRLQRALMKKRRSSVLPVSIPAFRPDGELLPIFMEQLHTETRQKTQVLCFFASIASVSLLLPIIVQPSFSADSNWSILLFRLIPSAGLCAYSALLYVDKRVGRTSDSLAWGTTVTTTLVGLGRIASDAAVTKQANLASNHSTALLFLVLLYLFTIKILHLPFKFAQIQGAILFLALTLAQAIFNGFTGLYVFTVVFHATLLLLILWSLHQHEINARRDIEQKSYLLEERRKAEKLLGSMLPTRILQEYLDGRVGHVSAVATVGFIQVELGQMTNRRGRFQSRSSMHDGEGQSLTGASTSASSAIYNSSSSQAHDPTEMIKRLHDTFKRIDAIVKCYQQRGVAKIETVSKSYLLCGGLLNDVDDHASATIDACLEILAMVLNRHASGPRLPIQLRIGIATGQVVGGIIGSNRRFFRLFGDTVNVSSRMCGQAKVSEMMITEETFLSMTPEQRSLYMIDAPRMLNIKGKGPMAVYRVSGSREDWQPTAGKLALLMANPAGYPGSPGGEHAVESLQNHSFVYHHLIAITRLSPWTLAFVTPDPLLEQCYYWEWKDSSTRSRRVYEVILVTFLFLLSSLTALYSDWPAFILLSVTGWLMPAIFFIQRMPNLKDHVKSSVKASLIIGCIIPVVYASFENMTTPLAPGYIAQAMLIFCCFSMRLQFKVLAPALLLAFALFVVVSAWENSSKTTASDFWSILIALFFTLICGLGVARTREWRMRLNFLLAYALEREQQQMEHFLNNLLPKFVLDVLHKRGSGQKGLTMSRLSAKRELMQQENSNSRSEAVSINGREDSMAGDRASESRLANDIKQRQSPSHVHLNQIAPCSVRNTAVSTRFALRFSRCTVFESDIIGYTALVSSWPPIQTLAMLNKLFSEFDSIALAVGVEKIETIGDAFIVVVFDGVPDPVLNFALRVVRKLKELNASGLLLHSPLASPRESRLGSPLHALPEILESNQEHEEPRRNSLIRSHLRMQRYSLDKPPPMSDTEPIDRAESSQIVNDNDPIVAQTTSTISDNHVSNSSHTPSLSGDDSPYSQNTARLPVAGEVLHSQSMASMSSMLESQHQQTMPQAITPQPTDQVMLLDSQQHPVHSAGLTSHMAPQSLETVEAKEFVLAIRMGIATGSAFGGIIGAEIPRFALFGSALDSAIAIEQNGKADEILVSRSTYEDAHGRFHFELCDARAGDQIVYRLFDSLSRSSASVPASVDGTKNLEFDASASSLFNAHS